jgi:hypothetical protein|tara:strand:- start:316 stop:525 length:210 start_codon:yes stop_codon:yes gene_type:complete
MNCILLTFLIVNALFWGLFPHEAHCQFVGEITKLLNVKFECPEHKIHLLMGLISFAAAIYVAQKDSDAL